MRQFDEIDDGGWFPAKYDRRYDLSLVLQYQLTDRINFGGVFIYATGNSITYLKGDGFYWKKID